MSSDYKSHIPLLGLPPWMFCRCYQEMCPVHRLKSSDHDFVAGIVPFACFLTGTSPGLDDGGGTGLGVARSFWEGGVPHPERPCWVLGMSCGSGAGQL